MTKPWLRLYRDAINRPKVGKLTLEERGFWVSLLMLSDDDGNIPQVPDLAWSLRITEEVAERHVVTLVGHGLVTRDSHVMSLHDWGDHQYSSDGDPTARERKQRQRERDKARVSAVTRDSHDGHAHVTRTDTDTDTDKKKVRVEAREEVRVALIPDKPSLKKPALNQKGSRWPSDAVVPEDWIQAGAATRANQKMPEIDLRTEAIKFANHWSSKAGGAATKIDWKRTWLNWCISDFAKGKSNGSGFGGRKSQLEQLADIVAEARVIDYDN